jgi:hypothetical protein
MNRETRLNLIFLGVFLAVSVPGAVLLFKKKLDPGAPPMFMPDYVRRRLPYMAPQRTPNEVVRVIPDVTGAWVTQVNRDHGGGDEVLLDDRRPIISDDHSVQITSLKRADTGTTLNLIVWTPATGVTIETAGHAAKIAKQEDISMPLAVKKELMNWGVIQPPPSVTWIEAHFDEKVPLPAGAIIRVSYRNGADDSLTQCQIVLPSK